MNWIVAHARHLVYAIGGGGSLAGIAALFFKDAIKEFLKEWQEDRALKRAAKAERLEAERMKDDSALPKDAVNNARRVNYLAFEVLALIKKDIKANRDMTDRMAKTHERTVELLSRLTVSSEVNVEVQRSIKSKLYEIHSRLNKRRSKNGGVVDFASQA